MCPFLNYHVNAFCRGYSPLQVLYLCITFHINEEFPETKTESLVNNMSRNFVYITLIILNLSFNTKHGLVAPDDETHIT